MISDHRMGKHIAASPLPLLPVPQATDSPSPRVRARRNRRLAITRLTNNAIISTNAMIFHSMLRSRPHQATGAPVEVFDPKIYPTPTIPYSQLAPGQRAAIDGFWRDACTLLDNCRRPTRGEDSGDVAAVDTYVTAHSHAPVPLVAARVALPDQAGTVPITNLLTSGDLDLIGTDLERIILPPDRRPRAPCARIPDRLRGEYAELVRRGLNSNLFALSDTPPLVVNGIFTIPKDSATPNGEQRLILDARPANACMKKPPWFFLPTPDVFARLVPGAAPLYSAKCDVSNFFHKLAIPESWSKWFGLPAVWSDEVGLSGPRHKVWPSCMTLPMGWSFSAFLAQRIHEAIIVRMGLGNMLITPDSHLRVDSGPRIAIYIDDVSFLGHCREEISALQLRYETTMEQHGLPTKPAKRCPPATAGVDIIGMAVDGIKHRIALSGPKMFSLIRDTVRVLRTQHCAGLDLLRLVGRWTWAALVRREALSAFHAVYAFARTHHAPARLWNSCVKELEIILGLAPLLYAKLSCQSAPFVVATDASLAGQGCTYARVDPGFTAEVHAATLTHRLKLRQVERSGSAERAGDPMATHDPDLRLLTTAFATSALPIYLQGIRRDWRTAISARWKFAQATINELEARAVKSAIVWMRSRNALVRDRRVLLLSDNAVVFSALNKGRSSSLALRVVLRSIAGHLLAGGLRVTTAWIPSAWNPADAPSRL